MTNDTKRTRVLLALLVGGALLMSAPVATAGAPEEPVPELRVFDDLDDEMHDPVVTCEFWVAGFDMPVEEGHITIETDEGDEVLEENWTADEEGDFVVGSFEFEPGNYTVMAWGEIEGSTVPVAEPVDFTVEECPPEPPEPACPTDLQAEALQNGDVRLTFTPANGTEGNNVYRSTGDQDPILLAELPAGATEFVDQSTEPGVTYTYEVRSVFNGEETEDCPTVEVTAIPVFPTVLGALAASTVGILAYAGLRRRL